jgi:hypothetical protein
VDELSKNGYDVVLSDELMSDENSSSLGSARELAERVLKNTDWKVDSEKAIEKIVEHLIYIKLPDCDLSDWGITRIIDEHLTEDPYKGVVTQLLTAEEAETLRGKVALGFYSSCTTQPYRF